MDAPDLIIDKTTRIKIIEALAEKLQANYIYPDIAEQVSKGLLEHEEMGDYIGLSEGEFFAYALTQHLQEVNQDEHLWVRYHPHPLPEDEGYLSQNQEWEDTQIIKAKKSYFGINKVCNLPAEIGYIKIHNFPRTRWGTETATAAITSLAHNKALIIDLRNCIGGYPDMVVFIGSYFFDKQPVHLSSIYWADEDRTEEFWSLPEVPGERFINKPVFILTSRETFSAGEGFTDCLQALKRAVVVGQQTDGGGNLGASFRLHPQFEAFIPVGRAFNPHTGEDMEKRGITPDFPTPPEQALELAYRLALEAVGNEMAEEEIESLVREMAEVVEKL
jgi:hypothetical protein